MPGSARRTTRGQTRAILGTDTQSSTDARTEGHGSRARIRLLALLLLTVFFAGAVLFVKLKLEDLRSVFEVEAERRTGLDLGIGKIQVSGLKGLIIQDFHTTFPMPDGPSIDLVAPVSYVYINLIDLLYGQITIDRIQIDDATITVNRPENGPWIAAPSPAPASSASPPAAEGSPAPEGAPPTEAPPPPGETAVTSVPAADAPAPEVAPAERPTEAKSKPDAPLAQEQALPEPASPPASPVSDPAADIVADTVAQGESAPVEKPVSARPALLAGAALGDALSFRVLGRNCTLRVNNVVGDSALTVHQLDFDAVRLTESTDYSVKLSGLVDDDLEKKVSLNLRFASLEDFDFRLQSGLVTADEANIFLPAQQHFVEAGAASAAIRIAGYPGRTMVVSMDLPFEGLRLRGQPELLQPLTGNITALANYNLDTHLLSLTTAQLTSGQLGGSIGGTVSFAGNYPEFDLRLVAGQLPVHDALAYALNLAGQSLAGLNVELKEPYSVNVLLQGTTQDSEIVVSADLAEGSLSYKGQTKEQPDVDLQFGAVNLAWDSREAAPKGSLTVRDGTVFHRDSGIKAEKIMGSLQLTADGVRIEPFNATIRDNPFVGTAVYSNETKEVTFTATGTVPNLENTPLGKDIKDLTVAGSAAVRCSGKVSREHQSFDLAIDATQAKLGFEWWFLKPVGIGLSLTGVNVDVKPGKSIKLAGNAMLDTVPIHAEVNVLSRKGKWQLETIRAKAEQVDAGTADKCLQTQYALSGSHADGMTLDWKRTDKGEDTKIFTVAGHIDALNAVPKGGTAPIVVRDAEITVTVEDASETDRTGDVELKAHAGALPPIGQVWFVPLQPDDPVLREKYKELPRAWSYHVNAEKMSLDPWEATEFVCVGTSANDVTDISSFTGKVGKGDIKGHYHLEDTDNIGRLSAEWNGVPARFLLRHLNFPEVLTGSVTGTVEYTMDQDDPGTLKGSGKFDVADGQFSLDVLQQQFGSRLAAGMSAVPLKFSHLKMDVGIEGDKITTKNVELLSDGITVTGDGTYVTEGDMDYTLKVAISPATAEKIPILRDSFNIEGHRLTQNNIELTFQVTGPAFNPTGQVAGLPPVGVTLISGAAELTSEALKVIDLPRQILLDLFKIGGAVAGPPKQ